MTSFPLQIVTPGGQAYDGMAQKLFCRTIVGDVTILARHCDYLTAVGMGEARVTTEDGTVRRAACIGGMLLEQADLSARDRELATAKLKRAQVRQSVAARR